MLLLLSTVVFPESINKFSSCLPIEFTNWLFSLLFKIINKSGVPFRLIYGRVGYSPPSPPREGWGIRFSVKYPTPQANPRRQRGGSKVFFAFDFFLNNSDMIMVLYWAFGYLAKLFSFVALFLTFCQRRSCAIMVLFFKRYNFRNMPNLSKAIFNQVDHSLTLGKQQNSFTSSTKINRPAFPFYTFIRIRNICVLREARWAPLLFSARSHAF